jgi:ABC-type phosphate transport system substrate-binding protein
MKNLLYILLASFIGISVQAQSYKVIVNKSNSTASKTKKEVSDLFLKKKSAWNDGTKVMPIDQVASSETRKKFTEDVHGKSVNAIKSFWQQAIFAGQGTPPNELQSDDEVVKYVSQNAGAIGYVSQAADLSAVKELKISN